MILSQNYERFLAALPFVVPSPHHQSIDVTDVEGDVLTSALLHKRIYKNKKEFSINFLHNVSHA
jgi:hypothetical protein